MASAFNISFSLFVFVYSCPVFLMPRTAVASAIAVSMSLIIRQHDIPVRAPSPRCCYAIPPSYTQTHLYTSIMHLSQVVQADSSISLCFKWVHVLAVQGAGSVALFEFGFGDCSLLNVTQQVKQEVKWFSCLHFQTQIYDYFLLFFFNCLFLSTVVWNKICEVTEFVNNRV